MLAEHPPDVFISHIHEEKGIALVMQHFIGQAFGSNLRVFVSSDTTSIGGGRKWFEHIINNLKRARVILVLISDESRSREWINFEAGCGEGNGAVVIPVGIRNFSLGKLQFPLIGYNGRSADDLEGIVFDIAERCGRIAERVERLEYMNALRGAEDAVNYKCVILRPYLLGQGHPLSLQFEIRNQGNTDIDLLHVDVWVPVGLCNRNWTPLIEGARDVSRLRLEEQPYYRIRLTALLNALNRLEPVLTRSMGWIQLPMLNCPLNDSDVEIQTSPQPIFYQVHARNYDTTKESARLGNIPWGPAQMKETQPGNRSV